jgi:uncharacterized protein
MKYITNALSVYNAEEIPDLLVQGSEYTEIDEIDIPNCRDILFAYFVPSDLDEIKYQKLYYRGIQRDDSILNATILTTLGCNFNCYYCYENKKGGFLSKSTRSNLINYYDPI